MWNETAGIKRVVQVKTINDMKEQARALAFERGISSQKAFVLLLDQNPQAYAEYMRQNPQLDGGKTANGFG